MFLMFLKNFGMPEKKIKYSAAYMVAEIALKRKCLHRHQPRMTGGTTATLPANPPSENGRRHNTQRVSSAPLPRRVFASRIVRLASHFTHSTAIQRRRDPTTMHSAQHSAADIYKSSPVRGTVW